MHWLEIGALDMNKRIKKKHNPRFSLKALGFSFSELEQVLGHDIDHKIKRLLANRRYHERRKKPKNTGMIELTTGMLEKIWIVEVEQSFHPIMDYYENKSKEE